MVKPKRKPRAKPKAKPTTNALVLIGPVRRGRPAGDTYDEELGTEICERIANGETLTHICCDEHMPERRTVSRWLIAHSNFLSRYMYARELQAHVEVDDTLDIADESGGDAYIEYDKDGKPFAKIDGEAIQRAKLRVETRRWRAERLNRRAYGQKVEHDITIDATGPSAGQELLPPGLGFLAGKLPKPDPAG